MSDIRTETPTSEPALTRSRAIAQSGRWPGLVWAVPLAALIIVTYLGLSAYAKQGVDVVVTFSGSGGARAGDTPVVYKGVTIGRVEKIEVSRDIRHVDMTLRLDPRTRPLLRDGAKFWLIGAQASLTDLSALRAVVSGVSIGASPGTGAPRRAFVGLDAPPPVPPDTPGRYFRLTSASIGATPVGAGVYFHGAKVGRVTGSDIRGSHDFAFGVFISAPYDRLVHADTLFFAAHAVQVGVGNAGLTMDLGPGSSPITGGVEFDDPPTIDDSTEAAAGTPFALFNTEADALARDMGPEVRYIAVFRGSTATPAPGAPVVLSGERVGRVLASRLSVRVGDRAPVTRVDLEIETHRLNLAGGPPSRGPDDRRATDAAMSGLLRGGYRLQVGQSPPIVGAVSLVLTQREDEGPAALGRSDGLPELPTARGSDVAALAEKTASILDKVNRVPLTQIGSDVRAITERLRQLTASPQLSDSLSRLDSTLSQVDQLVREVKPQIGPLVTKLDAAAGQLQSVVGSANAVLSAQGGAQDANLPDAIRQVSEAARSIRSLADYLNRHPEAVIRGKRKEP